MSGKKLTHVDARGEASMVDVSNKPIVERTAIARGETSTECFFEIKKAGWAKPSRPEL